MTTKGAIKSRKSHASGSPFLSSGDSSRAEPGGLLTGALAAWVERSARDKPTDQGEERETSQTAQAAPDEPGIEPSHPPQQECQDAEQRRARP